MRLRVGMSSDMLSDKQLLALFENQSISNEDWSHTLHIRVATIYLMAFSFDEALDNMKTGIKKLNAVNAVPESRVRGFHETLTVGWLKVVAAKLGQTTARTSLELLDTHPELLNSRLLSDYYSPERLMSVEAKANFIAPDLKSFDH